MWYMGGLWVNFTNRNLDTLFFFWGGGPHGIHFINNHIKQELIVSWQVTAYLL